MFQLHPKIATDTVEITRWEISRVLLMKDANYPWLILVPARADLTGLHQLSDADQPLVMAEITRASRVLEERYKPARINVAALGNMVEQLHIHVIARLTDDAAWPAPVWGVKPAQPYTQDTLQVVVQQLREALEG